MDNFARTQRGACFFDRDVPRLIKSINSLTEALDRHSLALENHTKALKENTERVTVKANSEGSTSNDIPF